MRLTHVLGFRLQGGGRVSASEPGRSVSYDDWRLISGPTPSLGPTEIPRSGQGPCVGSFLDANRHGMPANSGLTRALPPPFPPRPHYPCRHSRVYAFASRARRDVQEGGKVGDAVGGSAAFPASQERVEGGVSSTASGGVSVGGAGDDAAEAVDGSGGERRPPSRACTALTAGCQSNRPLDVRRDQLHLLLLVVASRLRVCRRCR